MGNVYKLEDWSMQSDHLIMVPYAQIPDMETGLNIGARNSKKQREIYLKNCCVSLVSAKLYNPEADVALVTNIEVPEQFITILDKAGVVIIWLPFEKFNFGRSYVWGLAFYKLCAQYYISHNTEYKAIVCLDSDTFTQANFSPIWKVAYSSIMLYQLGCGRPKAGVSKIYEEAEVFRGTNEEFVHYGGEFLAASSVNMRKISEREEVIFERMREEGYRVSTGDEFISSIVANEMNDEIQLANKYIFRFWTGAYRNVSPIYKTLLCVHIPAEKQTGMITLFNKYISQGQIPTREKAWKILHLSRCSVLESIKNIIRKRMK